MTVNSLDSIIGNSLGGLGTPGGAHGAASTGENTGGAGTAAGLNAAAILDITSLGGGRRQIVNTYDKVQLSAGVPEPVEAETLETADRLAQDIVEKGKTARKDTERLREDRVLAALTGMRLMQQTTVDLEEVWVGGLPQPTQEEMQEAYRRLSQRLSSPEEVKDPAAQNNLRVELREYFRSYDFAGNIAKERAEARAQAVAEGEETVVDGDTGAEETLAA